MSTTRCDPAALKPSTALAPALTPCSVARRRLRGGESQVGNSDPIAMALPLGGMHDAVGRELRQRGLVGLLELAAAARGKVAAGRIDMMRPPRQRALEIDAVTRHAAGHMATLRRDAIAPRSDADDGVAHSISAMASRTARASSPAVKAGPAIRAASRCNHTASSAARAGS